MLRNQTTAEEKIHRKDDKRCKQVKDEKKKTGIKSISKKERAKIWGAPKANKRDTKARPPEGANSVMTEIPRKITPTFEKKEEHLFFRKRNTYYFWARKSKNTFSRQPLHSPFVVAFRGENGKFLFTSEALFRRSRATNNSEEVERLYFEWELFKNVLLK